MWRGGVEREGEVAPLGAAACVCTSPSAAVL